MNKRINKSLSISLIIFLTGCYSSKCVNSEVVIKNYYDMEIVEVESKLKKYKLDSNFVSYQLYPEGISIITTSQLSEYISHSEIINYKVQEFNRGETCLFSGGIILLGFFIFSLFFASGI